jgi:hypothetical protein
MAVDNTRYNVPFRAPALPYPPQVYDQQSFEEFNKVLRIYFNQLDNALRNAMAVQEPYELQVSKGQIAGATPLYKFGFNPDIDGTEETIWATGGNYPYLTSASTVYISSSSTADSNGGTGANTVTVEGVDGSYNAKSVTVNMNGQTQVQVGDASSWLRVNRIFVSTSGSGGTAAGTIYVANSGVSSGVPTGVTYASVTQGANQSQIAAYTVPAGYTLYLDDVSFTAALGIQSKNVTVKFVLRNFGTNTFRTGIIETVQSNSLLVPFNYPFAILEKTDVECRAFSDTTNVAVSASFQGVLIKN